MKKPNYFKTKMTNRRVIKIRLLQHIGRRGSCWESIPNIAKALRIGKKRVTRYLDELRAEGKVRTTYRVRTTHIHEVTLNGWIRFPAMIDDLRFTPKQANALTALFRHNEIAVRDIGKLTLCSANTARRAIWKAAQAGILRIHPRAGFIHRFSWLGKAVRCLGKRTPKRHQRPLSKLHPQKRVPDCKAPSGEKLRPSGSQTTSFGEIPEEKKARNRAHLADLWQQCLQKHAQRFKRA